MKTERRHELQTNWLADRVGEIIVVLKPYAKGLTGVLLAVLVVWAAFLIMAHRSQAEEASNWNKLWDGLLGGSNAAEDLATLSESSPKQPTGQWALLILADNDLSNGVGLQFVEKKAGRDAIHNALDNYKTVLQNATDPLVREHALYGVGLAQESLCNVADAETAYKQLRTDYPTGSYSIRAQERLDDLARDSTKARYDWFKTLEPPPSGLGKGSDKTGGATGPQLPSELEPFSQFATPNSKTPPPEPKPDTGAATSKTPATGDVKTGDTKTPDSKTPETKTPATKVPDAKTPADKTDGKVDEKSPVIPKPADSKS
jgi:hypothetical protein